MTFRRANSWILPMVAMVGWWSSGCGTLLARRRGPSPGEQAFVSAGCHGCHTMGTFGTVMAGDLSHLSTRWSADKIGRWLRDPASVDEKAHMPRLQLSDEQIAVLSRYLASKIDASR